METTNNHQTSYPLAYFITFTCYGTWLHGGKEKSVDKLNNKPLSPYVKKNLMRESNSKSRMSDPAFILNDEQRIIVLNSLKHVCKHRNWDLIAAHVRTNHVHFIVHANLDPEKIMSDIKAYASRNLNIASDGKRHKHWTRHGSTRYLWRTESIYLAIRYIVLEQGKQSAVYKSEKYSLDTSEWT